MNTQNRVRFLFWVSVALLAVLSLSACPNWLGIPDKIDVDLAVKAGLDQQTLRRIDKINATIEDLYEKGDKNWQNTNATIKDINETLRNGVIPEVDKLLRIAEDGFIVGVDEETLQTANELIDTIDHAPDQWKSAATDVVHTLEGAAGTAAKTMADRVEGVIDKAQNDSQQLIAVGGTELRCNVDFLGAKMGDSINAFIGRSLVGKLRAIITGYEPEVPIPTPWVCHVMPDQVVLRTAGNKWLAKDDLIRVVGFNFDQRNLPTISVVDEMDQPVSGVSLSKASKTTSYLIEINLQGIDFRSVPLRSRLQIEWSNPPSKSVIAILQAQEKIIADFSVSQHEGTAPFKVTFKDQSEGNPTAWFWEFGDGDRSTSPQSIEHVYLKAGKYSVKLTITNEEQGTTDFVEKSDYITVHEGPHAAFKADKESGTAELTVNFTDLSTGNPDKWSWNFGDGTTPSHINNPTHTYIKAGAYDVSLTVTNAYGTDTITQKGYISVTSKPAILIIIPPVQPLPPAVPEASGLPVNIPPGLTIGLRDWPHKDDYYAGADLGFLSIDHPVHWGYYDKGFSSGEGFSWWTVPDKPSEDSTKWKLPAGVVLGLRHTNQGDNGATVFGYNSIQNGDLPGFQRMWGGDCCHEDYPFGFSWYVSTGGSFDWNTDADKAWADKLPRGTVLGLKQKQNNGWYRFTWGNIVYDCMKDDGPVPPGYRRILTLDNGAGDNSICWFEKVTGVALVLEQGSNAGVLGVGVEQNVDRERSDYTHFTLKQDEPKICQAYCYGDSNCKAWTFYHPNNWLSTDPVCWLKKDVPQPTANQPCCVAGVKLDQ